MKDILEHFNQCPFEVGVGCFKKSALLKSSVERMSLSVSLTHSSFSSEEFRGKFTSLVLSDFNDRISKKVFNYIFNFGQKSFVDLRNQFGASTTLYQNQMTKSRIVISDMYKKNWNYVITNSRISSEYIMNSSDYHHLPNNSLNTISNGLSYPIGILRNIGVWVDPYMIWDDNYMICFKEVLTEVSNFNAQIINETNFDTRLVIDFDFRFEVIDPEVFFVFEDEYQKNWSEIRQKDRDKKIDYILNGYQEPGSNS